MVAVCDLGGFVSVLECGGFGALICSTTDTYVCTNMLGVFDFGGFGAYIWLYTDVRNKLARL